VTKKDEKIESGLLMFQGGVASASVIADEDDVLMYSHQQY
jgi:hypothetical protein